MANLVINGQIYNGVNKVKIPNTNAGQEEFIQPAGSQTITENGTFDVSALASVVINISGSSGTGIGNVSQGSAYPSSASYLPIPVDTSLGIPYAVVTWSDAAAAAKGRTCGHIGFFNCYQLNAVRDLYFLALVNDATNGLQVPNAPASNAKASDTIYQLGRASTGTSFNTEDEFKYIVLYRANGGGE